MKKWLRRIMPDARALAGNRQLSFLGRWLHAPNLWHLNRRSVAGAVGVGFFMMYMPPVGQMLLAAVAAIVLRVNLPLSIALVWICNPLTIPPMFYFAYVVGAWPLGIAPQQFALDSWADWPSWLDVVVPLGLGMLMCATICSAVGYCGVRALWHWRLIREIRRRRRRYRAVAAASGPVVSTPSSSRHT
ncbi:MAG TPA: DUF2062 domain-containing protein [Lamprocystis sp. (in: g-proteobacteria)]|nr:DUF2062 domain-containing protein [Lamprocystis sp. (in: g-proteobacteria)]